MNTLAPKSLVARLTAGPTALAVAIRASRDGPVLARERVQTEDLAEARAEFWQAAYLRKGDLKTPLDVLPFVVQPVLHQDNGSRCAGYNLMSLNPEKKLAALCFTNASLDLVAARLARQLRAAGVLGAAQSFCYEVIYDPVETAPDQPPAALEAFTMTVKSAPLQYLRFPLPPLLAKAALVDGAAGEDWLPVIYTKDALAKAERFSRRGASQIPPVESGCALVGSLGSCSKTGEFFVVIYDALETVSAEETKFSLSYTDASWRRLDALIGERLKAQPASAVRLVGQAHGHNFLPLDLGMSCGECERRLTCQKTSCFPSAEDRLWTACVFPQQPWAACHIFGLTPRSEPVNALYGRLDGGRLLQRPYYVVADFDPLNPTK
jgi:hypothetical protein